MIKDIIIHRKCPLTHPKTSPYPAARPPRCRSCGPARRAGSGDPAEGRRKRGLRRGRILFSPYLESTHPAWVDRLAFMRRSTAALEGTIAAAATSDPPASPVRTCRCPTSPRPPRRSPQPGANWTAGRLVPVRTTGGERREKKDRKISQEAANGAESPGRWV